MATPSPDVDDGRQRLTRIQRLWTELQAARKDSLQYAALVERIRQESDAFRQKLAHDDSTRDTADV
jgi:hypothetical protein